MPLQRPWGFFGTGSDLFKPNSTGQLRSRQRRRTCHWNNHRFSSNRTGKCNRLRKRNHRFHSQSLQTNAYRNYKKKENTQRYGSLRNENIEKEKRKKKREGSYQRDPPVCEFYRISRRKINLQSKNNSDWSLTSFR